MREERQAFASDFESALQLESPRAEHRVKLTMSAQKPSFQESPRSFTRPFNRRLKYVFKGAATTVITKLVPIRPPGGASAGPRCARSRPRCSTRTRRPPTGGLWFQSRSLAVTSGDVVIIAWLS